MTWLAENWFWAMFGATFIAMHHLDHGCHGEQGSHGGGHGGGGKPPKKEPA